MSHSYTSRSDNYHNLKSEHSPACILSRSSPDLLHGLALYLQPQVDALTGNVVGFEGLLRRICDDGGVEPARTVLNEFVRTGQEYQLNRWVVSEAARLAAEIRDQGLNAPVSFNISSRCIGYWLVDDIEDALDIHELTSDALIVELTEDSFADDTAVAVLQTIRSMGVRVSIDDFGMAYSVLSLLHDHPVDALKVARQFVAGSDDCASKKCILEFVKAFSEVHGISVVVEGVESDAELQLVRELGLGVIQGFYYSPALPAEQAIEWASAQAMRSSSGPTLST